MLFTTNDTRHIIDHGAITRFPAYSHTNSAIFACIFEPDENDLAATVCPRHRDLFGTRWRRAQGSHGRVLCSIPTALAVHKSPSTTGGCGLTFALSKFVKETHKILLPVGSGMYLRRRTPSFSVSLKNHRRIKCSDSLLYPGNATVMSNKRRTDHSTKKSFYLKAYSYNDLLQLPFYYSCL